MIISLIFGIICIGTFDLCVYGHFGAGWAYSDDEVFSKVSVDNKFSNVWLFEDLLNGIPINIPLLWSPQNIYGIQSPRMKILKTRWYHQSMMRFMMQKKSSHRISTIYHFYLFPYITLNMYSISSPTCLPIIIVYQSRGT